jgi:hypothetical protein
VPGNHELWARRSASGPSLRGVARYERLVDFCRSRGVLTPEDPFAVWEGAGGRHVIALCFALYDYSFRPDDVPRARVLEWALDEGISAADERLLHPDPHLTRDAWCAARVAYTEARLAAIGEGPIVLVNHWTLRRDLVRLGRVSRYSPWCGTRATEDWHTRFPVRVAVTGHLHTRATDWRAGVRFEEVSLGYPKHWRQEYGAEHYLREILPGPPPRTGDQGPEWYF